MQLNLDCVKDVLLEIEAQNVYKNGELFKPDHHSVIKSERCSEYTMDDIKYTIFHLLSTGYIEGSIMPQNEGFKYAWIDRITPSGHEFLNAIRDEKVFNKLKKGVGKLASAPLNVIAEAAKEIAKGAIIAKAGGLF